MSKNQILVQIASALHEIANSIEILLKEYGEKTEGVATSSVAPTTTASEPITIEKIRGVLASKSQGAKQPEVKALIAKFGAKKLTDIDPTCYEELLREAEEI